MKNTIWGKGISQITCLTATLRFEIFGQVIQFLGDQENYLVRGLQSSKGVMEEIYDCPTMGSGALPTHMAGLRY